MSPHHMPYDTWWKPRLNGRPFGKVYRKMYGFHQAHHANYKCNLNVAAFFGIPLADSVFGTYKQPDELLLDGVLATKASGRKAPLSLAGRSRGSTAWFSRDGDGCQKETEALLLLFEKSLPQFSEAAAKTRVFGTTRVMSASGVFE